MCIKMAREVEIPQDVNFEIVGNTLKVSGQKATLEKTFPVKNIKIERKENKLIITQIQKTSKNRAIIGSYEAHLKNMFKGANKEFLYKLKVCSGHFPMSVKAQGNELQVSNFLGGKKMQKITIPQEVNVKINGEIIEVSSSNIEKAGNFASKIESMTRLNKKDRRIFQDGIFMIEKNGVEIKWVT